MQIKKDVINWIRNNFSNMSDFYSFLKYVQNYADASNEDHAKYMDRYIKIKSYPDMYFHSVNGDFIKKPLDWIMENYLNSKTKRYSVFNIRDTDGTVRRKPIETDKRKGVVPFSSYIGKTICGWTYLPHVNGIYRFERYNAETQEIEVKHMSFNEVRKLLQMDRAEKDRRHTEMQKEGYGDTVTHNLTGRIHLVNKETGKTFCGLDIENSYGLSNWRDPVEKCNCQKCLKKAGKV